MERSTIKKIAVISLSVVAVPMLLLAIIFNHYYSKLRRASHSNALATRQNALESKSVGLDFDGLSEELDKSILDALTSEILREQSRVIADEQVKALGSELEKQSISNILLVGVDNREGKFDGNSDTIIIVSIDRARKRITLTSVLRDTLVYLDGYGSRRINAAYALGGAEGLESVLKEIYGIDFSGFLVVNFNAVRNAVDKVGGIDLALSKDEIRLMNAYVNEQNRLVGDDPEKDVIRSYKGGVIHLNGNQALGYARNRYVGTDFHRTMRQRVVIEKCLSKLKRLNVLELGSLADSVLPEVYTDLTEKDIASLLLVGIDLSNYKISSLMLPVDGSFDFVKVGGQDVIKVNFRKNADTWYQTILASDSDALKIDRKVVDD